MAGSDGSGCSGGDSVGAGLQRFYDAHDFGRNGGADTRVAFLHLGPLRIPFPNGRQRRALLYVHDVNHLVTGYDTGWRGEACLAAWELRTRSWGGRFTLWLLVSTAIAWGLVICPRGMFGGWRLGRRTRGVLSLPLTRDELLALPLRDLRARLGFGAA
ncbi:MAG: hypothetical protein JWO31_296 [Phycisphaerales bacterium]|nr:hypothetical protein [Phycisphaerales bacterium]